MSSFVAFIPVRGGSKGIPGKNIRPLHGRPLVYWALDAATGCPEIDRVFVATDSDAIRAVVEAYPSGKVACIGRSPETTTDTASTESALLEFARGHEAPAIALIQATSPLLTAEDLSRGIRLLRDQKADSAVSVVSQRRFLWKTDPSGFATPVNYDPARRPRRQEFEGHWVENGAFYLCTREGLLASGCRLHGRVVACPMHEDTYIELDSPEDWRLVEHLLQSRTASVRRPAPPAHPLRLFITDVDGVLTDAGMYYSESGEELKKFNTRDGHGIQLLREAGIPTAIITRENTAIVSRRARKLRVDFLRQGVLNKLDVLHELLKDLGVRPEEAAYIGDDLHDLEVLRAVGRSACPADAVPSVREAVGYVCRAAGGQGCVREWIDLLLEERASMDRTDAGSRGVSSPKEILHAGSP